jgi:hypothetical protein
MQHGLYLSLVPFSWPASDVVRRGTWFARDKLYMPHAGHAGHAGAHRKLIVRVVVPDHARHHAVELVHHCVTGPRIVSAV